MMTLSEIYFDQMVYVLMTASATRAGGIGMITGQFCGEDRKFIHIGSPSAISHSIAKNRIIMVSLSNPLEDAPIDEPPSDKH